MHIVYATHARRTDNVGGIAPGHSDPDLATRGVDKCTDRSALWADRTFDVIVASDLLRSRRTAELAFEGRDILNHIDPRLCAYNCGDLDATPESEVDAIRPTRVIEPYPGGKNYEDVATRTNALLADLAREYPHGNVRRIGHHAQRVALPHLANGIPLDEVLAQTIENDCWQPEWEYRYGD
jgi:broad specificity phosphatase PhoE